MTREQIQKLVDDATKKHEELADASKKLRLAEIYKHRFIALGMIDFYLTRIRPGVLAEYYRARQKGWV